MSVVFAGFIGGRDGAVEERRGGAVRPGGHSTQPCFSLLSLLYHADIKYEKRTLVIAYSTGVERKVFC